MKILVTGAGGFVGRKLCSKLNDAGYSVVAVVRSYSETLLCDKIPVIEIPEIGDVTDWTDLLKGVDSIVHLAARTHIMNDTSAEVLGQYRLANVEGTMRLAAAAATAGVRRFIYLSSIKVYGEATENRIITEKAIPQPRDAYGISKWEAEQILNEISKSSPMQVVIIRSPLVYGPGAKGNLLRLMRQIDRGLPVPLGRESNRRSLISLNNLTDALMLAATMKSVTCGTYILSDGSNVSSEELSCAIAAAMGKKARLLRIPESILKAMARLLPGVKAATERLTSTLLIDSSGFNLNFGWIPQQSFRDGINEMVHDYLYTKGKHGEQTNL